jgi:hypothetical protein
MVHPNSPHQQKKRMPKKQKKINLGPIRTAQNAQALDDPLQLLLPPPRNEP